MADGGDDVRVIRALQTAQDLDKVVALWCRASIASHDFMPPAFWQAACPAMRDCYLPQANTAVMAEKGGITGFVSCIEQHIAALFVDPTYQNESRGSALLLHVLADRDIASVDVYAANLGARRFYERHGFRVTGQGIDDATDADEYFMEYHPDH